MSDFNQAIKWLEEGKKVRRPSWEEKSYWIFGIDKVISWTDGRNAHIHLNQIEATDWELYEEKKEEIIGNPIYWASKERDKYWKKKIQKAQRRLKEDKVDITDVLGVQYNSKLKEINKRINKRVDEIFKEEFGDKLIE